MAISFRTVPQALSTVNHQGVRIAITGAGGWLGRELADILLDAWGDESSEQFVLLASNARKIRLASGREVQLHSLADADVAGFAPTHIVHLAFLTRERVSEMPVEQYIETNRGLSRMAVELMNLASVRGFMFTSSGAALTPATGTAADWYGELKREDELAFTAASAAAAKNCVTCRIWSVSGANMQKVEQFALGSLISQALAGGPLQVRAEHPVYRRYVDVGEFLGLGLMALLDGETIVVDSAGERVEVGPLAERVAAVLSPESQVVRPPMSGELADDYTADPASMDQLAAHHHVQLMDLDAQIQRTSRGIRASRSVGELGS